MTSSRNAKLLITGLSPDRVNTNTRIRQAIKRGAEETGLFEVVSSAPIEVVLSGGQLDFNIVLAVGGSASDTVHFELLRKRTRAAGGILLFWTHEDPYEFDLNRRIFAIADRYFTNERATLPFYGNEAVEWLPLGADWSFFRKITPYQSRSIDLFFCGYGYPIRLHILSRIKAVAGKALVMAIYGTHLKDAMGDSADDRHLSIQEMAEIASRSLLTLNVGRDLAIANSQFGIVAETPGPRTFDLALSGSPQIVFDDGVQIDAFFERNREIFTFDRADDVVERVHWMRANPTILAEVAAAAQDRVIQQHLYKHRMEKMMSLLR